MLWIALFGGLLAVGLLCILYLTVHFHRFSPVRRLGEKHRLLAWLLALLPVAGLLCFARISSFAAAVVLLHLTVIWIFCNLIGTAVRRIRGQKRGSYTPDAEGICALVLCAAVLGAGWFFAHHVFQTDYRFETEKPLPGGKLRIAAIADLHLGTTLDADGFIAALDRIAAQKPDLLLIAGDYVDDSSTKDEMRKATAALGRLQLPCGVYFVFGNHDQGYGNYRNFSMDDLRAALAENGVTVLEDQSVTAAEGVTVLGRRDRSDKSRADMRTLTAACDPDSCILCMDHQPNAFAEEAAAQVDFVFCGHTHGGHIFPAGQIGMALGANDRLYGTEQRGNTVFTVTSGISGWGIPFKTGAISEYLIIDLVNP